MIIGERLLLSLGILEVLDGILVVSLRELAQAHAIVALRHLFVEVDRLIEIIDCHLVVAHIIEDAASCQVHSLIILDLLQNLGEAFERELEFSDPVVHKSQVEATCDKAILLLDRILVALNSFLVQLLNIFGVSALLVCARSLGLHLVGETL